MNIPADCASWVQINEAESSGKALVLSVDENETGTERSTVVNVTRSGKSTVLATVTIKQSDITLQAGEFVIEEIYFTGTAFPETGKPDRWLGDQYIKIRNNSDEDLYADGMMLILSSGLNSGMNSEMIEGKDFRKECCAGNAFYCIPGNGPGCAGQSRRVADRRQQRPEPHHRQPELVGRHESRFRVVRRFVERELSGYRQPRRAQPRQMVRFDIDGPSAPQPRLQRRGYRHAAPSA